MTVSKHNEAEIIAALKQVEVRSRISFYKAPPGATGTRPLPTDSAQRTVARKYMPGSPTTQDRSGTCVVASVRFAFRICNHVGVLDEKYFVAQWLACTLPCQRFAAHLTVCCARLGVGVDLRR